MNYFGHAAIAGLLRPDPAFVFGAMLPDLVGMTQTPISDPEDAGLRAGLAFHVETDAAFHQTEAFLSHNRLTLGEMKDAGIRRGPARAAAHIGVEMLIDAALCQTRAHLDTYRSALRWALDSPESLPESNPSPERGLVALSRLLLERGAGVFAPTTERLTFRLGRTLEQRPRLTPTPSELGLIGKICAGAAARVHDALPDLLRELEPLWAGTATAEITETAPPAGNRIRTSPGFPK